MMAKLALELERDQIRRGERIRGKLHIDVHREFEFRELVLSLECKMHYRKFLGRCSSPGGILARHQLLLEHPGKALPGSYIREFEIQMPPDAPISYHGKFVRTDWILTAKYDLPLKLDIRAQRELKVIP